MKKKYSRILGIGLTLMLLTSLVGFVFPVSAAELEWKKESGMPSKDATKLQLAAGTDISDLAVGNDGTTIYAADSEGNKVYKSVDAGVNWKALDISGLADPTLVAVAPDDVDIVAAVGDNNEVYVSVDGGTKFDNAGTTGLDTIYAVDISMASAGAHNIAVAGVTGGSGDLSYYNLGATFASWTSAISASTWDSTDFAGVQAIRAIKFSPSFAADKVIVAVTEVDNNTVKLEMASLSSKKWNANAGFFSAVTVDGTTGIAPLNAASIALSPDYYAGDDTTAIAFVGIASTNATWAGSLTRFKYDVKKLLKETVAINSVDYDGTNLVAGAYASNVVYRSDDPLASSPEVPSASGYQRPSGTNSVTKTVVVWADSDVVAGTTGDESAFSVSGDNGKTFNDISLIDTDMDILDDVATAEDNSVLYVVSNSGGDMSVWRKASDWERVLAIEGDTGFIVRIAPENPDVVYVCDVGGGTTLLFSDDAGETNWKLRALSAASVDFAVESAKIAYALSSDGKVRKTTDGGFIFGSAKDTGIGNGATIVSISEDNLLVGGSGGHVAWSTDGNASTTTWEEDDPFSSGNVQVAASGLEDGDFIYAATSATGNDIKRLEVGTTSWKGMSDGTFNGYGFYGLVLSADNVLYGLESGGGNSWLHRTLVPATADSGGAWSDDTSTAAFTKTPQALKTSAGSLKLWAIDEEGDNLFAYTDTLYAAGPELVSPPSGFTNSVNPITGRPAAIAFSWSRPSKATKYEVQMALDEKFTEKVVKFDITPSPSTADPIVAMIGPYAAGGDASQEFEFQPGLTYYWRVKAKEPLSSPYSSVRKLEIEPALGVVPMIDAPAPGATGVDLTPTFAWSTVDGATSYTFQIALDAGFTSGGWTTSGLTNNAYVAEQALAYSTTYYWRVTAYDGTTPMGDAAVGIFTTMEKPAAPTTAPPPATVTQPPVIIPQAIPTYLLWVIVGVAIVLVISLVILIWRTRRVA